MMRLNFRQRLSGFAVLAACTVLVSSGSRVVSQTTASHTPDGPFLMEKLGRGLGGGAHDANRDLSQLAAARERS